MVDKNCVSSVSSSGESHSSQSDIPRTPGPPIDEGSNNAEANLDSANQNPLPPPPPLPPSPANSSTPSKLRRRVSANDELDYKVPIQRLVEYFFVVSCRPRFDPQNKAHHQQQPRDGAARSTAPGTPELILPPTIPRRVTPASSTPIKMPTTNQEIRLDDGEGRVPLPLTPKQATATSNKKRGIAMFKKRERTDEKEIPMKKRWMEILPTTPSPLQSREKPGNEKMSRNNHKRPVTSGMTITFISLELQNWTIILLNPK
ncbi:hypothetical protein IV203_036739 [Nitzschia inconspicua]|uniref:Uncharacterized protein n=1 Tax=Nitzschia inconspicua TaxID=303405 RepID=A0A9K3LHA4_9STRA|nr:hypothetical protein IV203_036739 [Nitzschia inconspicua]